MPLPLTIDCPYGTVSLHCFPPEYDNVVYLMEVKEEYRGRPSDGLHPEVRRWINRRFPGGYEPHDNEGRRIYLIRC